MNQLENCQARHRSNTWMGRTRTDGPDEFEPTKFDCTYIMENRYTLIRQFLRQNKSCYNQNCPSLFNMLALRMTKTLEFLPF